MPTLEITRSSIDLEVRQDVDDTQAYASPAGGLISDFEVADPEIIGAFNSWVPCFFSLEKTDSCCAY